MEDDKTNPQHLLQYSTSLERDAKNYYFVTKGVHYEKGKVDFLNKKSSFAAFNAPIAVKSFVQKIQSISGSDFNKIFAILWKKFYKFYI